MYRLRVESSFAAAHRLKIEGHKCENLHGHNWRVVVMVQGKDLDRYGMLVDFHDLKKVVERHVSRLDHVYINDVEPFGEVNPTTENICRHLCEIISPELPQGVEVHSVEVYESDTNMGVYLPHE